MTFTDEDKERWKGYTDGMRIPFNALQEIHALIERLDAAEEAMKAAYSAPFAMMQGAELWWRWRKAAGK